MSFSKKPELLCPAGSPLAMDAAIDGGADAVYMGGTLFNARIYAKNFTGQELTEAIARAHFFGTKVYITLNTLVYDREMADFLRAAEHIYRDGADGVIIADIGAASVLHRYLPDLPLHASTQMSGHCTDAARILAENGFTRMVCAREMPYTDICEFTKNSPIEAEVFVHGALCVCHSGQCLFSSVVGGRSGNRGECAQPCRLPYNVNGKQKYPLSLKDLSLAEHVPELIDAGVASFKIEGRMKSPEYIRAVASVWRRLIDEGRRADKAEMDYLAGIFSRSGFTDAYFTSNINHTMLGVRSEADKYKTRMLEPFDRIRRKIPIDISVSVQADKPMSVTAVGESGTVTVYGQVPMAAKNAPIDRESVLRSLSKLGDTPYEIRNAKADVGEGLMVPVSWLNMLRRSAVEALKEQSHCLRNPAEQAKYSLPEFERPNRKTVSARFYSPSQISEKAVKYFDRIYLPLHKYDSRANGVIMPAVIFDHEKEKVRKMLGQSMKSGAEYALVGNIGHIGLADSAGFKLIGDYRLNIYNRESVAAYRKLGLCECILSPELTLPQIRDIGSDTAVIVYGRLPLMTLEKCVIRETADCVTCQADKAVLCDRRGVEFPVLREWEHRNVIYNSVPVYMADRKDMLAQNGVVSEHFIFSTESSEQVDKIIDAYLNGLGTSENIKRIKTGKQ